MAFNIIARDYAILGVWVFLPGLLDHLCVIFTTYSLDTMTYNLEHPS